ncbi:MAG: hypothetical protein H7839_04340 [Magnetococcus sp. YQC-5]
MFTHGAHPTRTAPWNKKFDIPKNACKNFLFLPHPKGRASMEFNLSLPFMPIVEGLKAGLRSMKYTWMDKINNTGFYIEKFNHNVTIYTNGHGIAVSIFTIRVLNKETFGSFTRRYSLEDACRDVVLPPLKSIHGQPFEKRFTENGFWYESDPADLISNFSEMDQNPRTREWMFHFNKASITKKSGFFNAYKKISFTNAISTPGMQPINHGYFDLLKANNQDPLFSRLFFRYPVGEVIFTLAFEKSVHLDGEPHITFCPEGQAHKNEKVSFMDGSSIFYKRFVYKKQNVKQGAEIIATFKVAIPPG